MSENVDRILALLYERQLICVTDMCPLLGLSNGTINKGLKILESRGRAENRLVKNQSRGPSWIVKWSPCDKPPLVENPRVQYHGPENLGRFQAARRTELTGSASVREDAASPD